MKILVIGGGGREHALAWRLAKSSGVTEVFVAPGNAGTALEPGLKNLAIVDLAELADFAESQQIHATVVGPEGPLANGVVDLFRNRGLRIFGPTQAAAQLESSKDFAKRFMTRHGIPTASFETFTDRQPAHAYLDKHGAPIVIKADGLAAGKGVVVATTAVEAHAAVDMMLGETNSGARIVIEEFVDGEEASFMVMVDGRNALALATSQDHKRLKDGDLGPNTGGMGAYSPAPVVTPELHGRVMREVIMPSVNGMAADGIVFTGFLYAGLMIKADGSLRVLEFNCRMGDPETQPIMMRLKSDLLSLIDAGIDGRLGELDTEWDRRVALGVVMAAAGYPEAPRQGDTIHGLPLAQADAHVFHAGTQSRDDDVVTSGGRVLCVTALGDSAKAAQKRAYEVLDGIGFDGMQCRRDIGFRAIRR